MKTEYKLIGLSIIFGLSFWVIDALFDYLFFYDRSFLGLLIFDVPDHEVYIRLVVILCFLIFSILISRALAKRKKVEQEIEVLSRFPSENPNPVLRIATDGVVLYTNDAGKRVFKAEVGKKMPERYLSILKKVIASQQSVSLEEQVGDQYFSTVVKSIPKAGYLNMYSMDITDRTMAEDERGRFLATIETAKEAAFITSPDAKIIYTNEAMDELFGYKKGELLGKYPPILSAGPTPEVTTKQIIGAVEKEGYWEGEIHNRKKNGTEFISYAKISAFKDKNGKISNFVSTQHDVTERKKAEEKIHVYQKRLRSLASKLTLVEERERRRLATELHDSIGQLLALCRIKLGELGRVTPSFDSRPLLEEIGDLLDQMIKYIRSLTLQLGPPVLYELGLEAALEWLVEYMQERYRIQTKFEVDGEVKSVDEELRVFLFRAVQELMVNIAKHAKTDKAKVSVCWENESIYLSVEDRGVGFNTASLDTPSGKDTGFGLFSIREHIKYFGGKLCIQSKPGEGTQVALMVLLKAPQKGTKGG